MLNFTSGIFFFKKIRTKNVKCAVISRDLFIYQILVLPYFPLSPPLSLSLFNCSYTSVFIISYSRIPYFSPSLSPYHPLSPSIQQFSPAHITLPIIILHLFLSLSLFIYYFISLWICLISHDIYDLDLLQIADVMMYTLSLSLSSYFKSSAINNIFLSLSFTHFIWSS